MFKLEINDTAANAALDALAEVLDDLTPAMQEIGEFLVRTTKLRFVEGASPGGAAWAPKSQTTKDAYRRRGDRVDDRPLFGPSGALSGTIFSIPSSQSVEVGSPMIYSAVMQRGAAQGAFGRSSRGGPIPWGDIPARPFIGLSDSDQVGVQDIVAEYLAAAANGR